MDQIGMELGRPRDIAKLLCIFCFFIYPPALRGSPLLSYAIIYGISIVYIILNYKIFYVVSLKQFNMLFISVIILAMSVLYPALRGTNDFSYIKTSTFIFRKLLIYIFLAHVLVKTYKENLFVETFMYFYALVHVAYVLGTMIFVTSPLIKNIWFSIFSEVTSSERLLESFGYTFRIGWQGFSGYRLTLHCSISCIFLLYLYFIGGSGGKITKKQFFIPYIFCFMGNMFYGRTGIVVTGFISIMAITMYGKRNFKNLLFYIGNIALIFFLIYRLRNMPLFSSWFIWMSSPFKNLITTGSFNNSSFSATTQEMIFMPNFWTVLLGDGYFSLNGHYYMGTDSGIMRNILFWGIFGALLSYGMTIYLIWENRRHAIFLMWSILVCFLIFEIKGDVYYEFSALLLGMMFVESIKKKSLGIVNQNSKIAKESVICHCKTVRTCH